MSHTEIPIVETAFRPLPGPKTERIWPAKALDHEYVVKNLEPQIIRTEGKHSVINVLSPYTDCGLHVMIMDTTPSYKPTPTEITYDEGEHIMNLSSRIVDFQSTMPNASILSWAYNCSPWNYGQAEAKAGGMQSVISKFHPQIWNRPPDDIYAPLEAIPAPAREFIEGDSLTKIAGRLIQNQLAILSSPFINEDTIRVDKQGLHAELDSGLAQALKTPGFFSDFIKPLHFRIEQATIALSRALTDKDFAYVRAMMQSNYELGPNPKLPDVQAPPRLIPLEDRKKNIEQLRDAGYPDDVVAKLQLINGYLKNRDEVPERKWVRDGFGYAFVITQDVSEPVAHMHIRPAILLQRSRGGVVEAQGIALHRTENAEANEEIIQENVINVHKLQAYLDKTSPGIKAA